MSKKTQNNIDGLIGQLCDDLSPIKKIWCPYHLFIQWAVISFAYLGIVFFAIGLRHDIYEQLENPIFLFEGLIGIGISLSAALCASMLTIPDMRGNIWLKAVPTTLFAVFMCWNIIMAITHGLEMPHLKWAHCMNNGIFMQAFPLIFIIFLSLRGNTTQPLWMMFMNVLSVTGISWIGLRLTCSMDDMGHAFLYHFLPVTVIGALLIFFARRIFKW